MLTQALRDAGFEVVGEAADGDEALALYRELRPDAMTLDLAMPGLDGIGVLRALRGERSSLPVVVVSRLLAGPRRPRRRRARRGRLRPGAPSPSSASRWSTFAEPRRRCARRSPPAAAAAAPRARRRCPPRRAVSRLRARRAPTAAKKVVLIATSTGGPRALARLIPALPSPLGAGGMIIQHMPAGFTASLAARLDRSSQLHGASRPPAARRCAPTPLLLAPGGSHLRLDDDGVVRG